MNNQNVCYEVWGGFNGDAVGGSYYDNSSGKFVMWINDTSGSWGLSKLSRGLMPHYWGIRYALLDHEFEVKRELSDWDLILDIDLKLVAYAPYTHDNSSTNVAIVLFFESVKPGVDYQVKCYQTELQFFSYYGDGIYKDQVNYFEWRNDSVAQFKLADNLQLGEHKHYSINLTSCIQQMMDFYKLDHVKLKHVEIFTEAYKGYCEFEVYQAKMTVEQKPEPSYLKSLMLAVLILALFASALLIFCRRKKSILNFFLFGVCFFHIAGLQGFFCRATFNPFVISRIWIFDFSKSAVFY
ncbi:MAG: hypothetical protein QXQ53_07540 [Candidatus Methanosuratincola sp.]